MLGQPLRLATSRVVEEIQREGLSVAHFPMTPFPPQGEQKAPRKRRGKSWRRGRVYEPGTVLAEHTAPLTEVVSRVEGPGWIGAAELAIMLGLGPIGITKLYVFAKVLTRGRGSTRVDVRSPLATSVLLLPHLKRYYRFTPESWEQMLAERTELVLSRK
jgi:hypothetical protein